MENICTACLCSGRNLYFIADTNFYGVYTNILNEVPVYDLSEICVRICWECRALLHRFHVFKERVKQSHTELKHYLSQPVRPKSPPTNPPNLQIHVQYTTSYPEVKLEPIDAKDSLKEDLVIKNEGDGETLQCEMDDNILQSETDDTHCEPITFVHVFDVRRDKNYLNKTVNKRTRKSKPPKVKTRKEKSPPKKSRLITIKENLKIDENNTSDYEEPTEKRTPKKRRVKTIKEDLKVEENNTSDYEDPTENSKTKKRRMKTIKEDLKLEENNTSDYDDPTYVDNYDVEDCKEEKIADIKEFICEGCCLVFGSKDELEKHKEIKHNEIETLDVRRVVVANGVLKRGRVREDLPDRPTCVECNKQFSSKKTYRYHRNVIHRGQNQHPCPRCDKVFQWRSNLGRHLRSHKAQDSGELHCKLCDKKFSSVATYQQHLKTSKKHVDEAQFNFVCNECGRKFVSKTRLRDHIDWEHLHKDKFRCQPCNKPFKSHTSLYMHRRAKHPASGERTSHLCHVCGKCYTNPNKLKYHIVAMHTCETPYKCTLCDTAFRWYSSLYRHTREVHYKMRLQPNRYKSKKSRKEQGPPEH